MSNQMNKNTQFMESYNIGFYHQTKNPNVMRRENFKTKSCEYIVICQDTQCIASTKPEKILNILLDKYKININPDSILGGKYPHGPGGTMICQLGKYVEK